VQPAGGVHFRVWAPAARNVAVEFAHDRTLNAALIETLQPEEDGYFSAIVPEAAAGVHYKFRLDGEAFPDPASRFQPDGPHGASRIIDPGVFPWTDHAWGGIEREGQIIYEMHIGTFTPEGTWAAATEQLTELADLGVTLLEVMPVAEFPGRYGWGYDGVDIFAPTRLYGEPDEFRHFVDRAHALGLGVLLDVVYNHLGPDGNYLKAFSPDYFSRRHATEWGEAMNFDDANSQPVREFFLTNAAYWIDEYHLDGLRLDATQQIHDDSEPHILCEIVDAVRAAGGKRRTYVVGENEPQDTRLIRAKEQGGFELDSLWNDDFHHAAIVALTGRREAYYMDYQGNPQEFISAAKWGYLFQGQRYKWQKTRRGTPTFGLEPANFVTFIQNHDQIANALWGHRVHTLGSADLIRAITALLLLGPGTPMLFQGQEFAASTPFLYFADHNPELAVAVAAGRAEFLRQFPSIDSPDATALLANPEDEQTFLRCKLDFADREKRPEIYRLHRDLIHLRKSDPLLARAKIGAFDGAVIAPCAFVLRFFGTAQDDRLLVVNLGQDLHLDPAPEPLLAPPLDHCWKIHWSSEDPKYGGGATPPLDTDENWRVPARATVLLIPTPQPCPDEPDDRPKD
jgi:maltooligosyltrehalose trehalohydrolase